MNCALLVVVLVLAAEVEAGFNCGSKGTNTMQIMLAKFGCPKFVKAALQRVCDTHENCYSCQRGRKQCDKHMCQEFDTALGVVSPKCKGVAKFFCGLVRTSGSYAYKTANRASCNNALY